MFRHERKNIALIPLSEEGEVLLRYYELIAEIHPMLKSVSYFCKFAVRYSRHPQHKKVQAVLVTARTRDELYTAARDTVRRRLTPEL